MLDVFPTKVLVSATPESAAVNRTMAVFSKFTGSGWTEPVPINNDGTPDFHPQLVVFSNGSAVSAWENGRNILPSQTSFEEMKANLEISVAFFDPNNGWKSPRMFTFNSYLDRSAKLSAKGTDDVLIVWISNETNHPTGDSRNPNKLWFSRYKGNSWTTPQRIANVPFPILKYDLAYDGAKAYVVLSLDTDNDLQTINDHELFRFSYENNAWSTAQALTGDELPDDNPQMSVDPHGKFILCWLKANEISSIVNFQSANREVIRRDEYTSNLADFKLATSGDGKLGITWADASEYSSDLWVTFYDPLSEKWGMAKQLTHDPETERSVTSAFYGFDTIVGIYNRTQVGFKNSARQPAPLTIPKPGATDLYVMKYILGEDVMVESGSFRANPINPAPGDLSSLKVTVLNAGDQPEGDIPIAFYQGNPSSGGVEIGRINIPGPVAAGGSTNLVFSWVIPPTIVPLSIFCIVDPDRKIQDVNRINNVAELQLTKQDLSIERMSWTKTSDNVISVIVRVRNEGSIDSQPTTLSLAKSGANGPPIFTHQINALRKGEAVDLVTDLPASNQALDFYARIDGISSAIDFNVQNNSDHLRVEPASPSLDLRFGSLIRFQNGYFKMVIENGAGRNFSIEVSTNLVDWAPMANPFISSDRSNWTDTNAVIVPYQFYRVVTP